ALRSMNVSNAVARALESLFSGTVELGERLVRFSERQQCDPLQVARRRAANILRNRGRLRVDQRRGRVIQLPQRDLSCGQSCIELVRVELQKFFCTLHRDARGSEAR